MIFGESLGSAVALELALDAPARGARARVAVHVDPRHGAAPSTRSCRSGRWCGRGTTTSRRCPGCGCRSWSCTVTATTWCRSPRKARLRGRSRAEALLRDPRREPQRHVPRRRRGLLARDRRVPGWPRPANRVLSSALGRPIFPSRSLSDEGYWPRTARRDAHRPTGRYQCRKARGARPSEGPPVVRCGGSARPGKTVKHAVVHRKATPERDCRALSAFHAWRDEPLPPSWNVTISFNPAWGIPPAGKIAVIELVTASIPVPAGEFARLADVYDAGFCRRIQPDFTLTPQGQVGGRRDFHVCTHAVRVLGFPDRIQRES